MTTTKTFTTLQTYKAKDDARLEKLAKIYATKDAAQEELTQLRQLYEKTIHDSVTKGTDATEELDALSDKIDAVERTLKRRTQECQVARTLRSDGLSEDDLLNAWKTEYIPAVKKAHIEPAAQALMDAKKKYVDAFLAYRKVIAEIERERQACIWTMHPTDGRGKYTYAYNLPDFATDRERDAHCITDTDLYYLAREERPESLKTKEGA